MSDQQSKRSFRDINVLIPPGSSVQVRAPGDFIFLKFADRPVRCIVDGNPVTYEIGDRSRFPSPFDWFEAENPDPANPCQVTFVVGFGDYDRKIIQGEISIVPGVRGADGTWRDDSRQTIAVDLWPLRASPKVFAATQELAAAIWPNNPLHVRMAQYGNWLGVYRRVSRAGGDSWFGIELFDRNLRLVGAFQPNWSGTMVNAPDDWSWHPSLGLLALRNADVQDPALPITRLRPIFKVGMVSLPEVLAECTPNMPGETQVRSICAVPDGVIAVGSNGTWVKFGLNGEVLRTAVVKGGSNAKLRYDWSSRILYICTNTRTYQRYDVNTWSPLGNEYTHPASAARGASNGFLVSGRYLYTHRFTSPNTGNVPVRWAYEEFVEPIRLAASNSQCQGVDALTWRQGDLVTTAAVEASEIGEGVLITGEVVRAALEYHFQRPVRDGYLDHVFGFETTGDSGGALTLPVSSGGRSFAAAGVQDDFSVIAPCAIKITFDEGLPLGSPLEA